MKEVLRRLKREVMKLLIGIVRLSINRMDTTECPCFSGFSIGLKKVNFLISLINKLIYHIDETVDQTNIVSNYGYLISIIHKGSHLNTFLYGMVNIECEDGSYVYLPRKKHDRVLKKLGIDLQMEGYILFLIDGGLTDVYGIGRNGVVHKFDRDEFKTNHNPASLWHLQAPIIALYGPGNYKKGIEELGYHVDYMVWDINKNEKFFLEEYPNVNLRCSRGSISEKSGRLVEYMLFSLGKYDIFHFHSNCSLLGHGYFWDCNCDMPYIRKMNKIIVNSYWGYCDVRRIEDETKGRSECDICTILRPQLCENAIHNRIISRTRASSNIILTNGRLVTDYGCFAWIDNPINLEKYGFSLDDIPPKFRLKETGKIKIYHSFGNASKREDLKGTAFIREAVCKLDKEGYNVELIYFNKVPHKDIRYYEAQADIVIDQLYCGWYGTTGAECLSLGKIVVTYVNPDVEKYVKEKLERELPVISASPDTIYDVLKNILDNLDNYKVYEAKGREFAIQYHDYRHVARKLLDFYERAYKETLGVDNQCVP